MTIIFMPTGTSTSGPLVGSIELKNPNLSLAAETVRGIYEGPYEIERTTITLSGNVADGQPKAFTLTELLEISDGNLVEVSIASDDAASVTVAPLDLTVSSDGGMVTGKSEWQASYGNTDSLPVFVSYTNRGDTYNISVTITVKRSLRRLRIQSHQNSPEEFVTALIYPEAERALKLFEWSLARRKFGCGPVRWNIDNPNFSEDAPNSSLPFGGKLPARLQETRLWRNDAEVSLSIEIQKSFGKESL